MAVFIGVSVVTLILASVVLVAGYANSCETSHRGDACCPNENLDNIIRPCPYLDVCCVREWFEQNAKCLPSLHPGSSPLKLNGSVNYLSIINSTIVQGPVQYTGVHYAEVKEFYINKDTDVIVLALMFPHITSKANTSVRYHQPGKEVKVINTETTEEFYQLITTTLFMGAECPELCLSETHAYVPKPSPVDIGDCLRNAAKHDPNLQRGMQLLSKELGVTALECLQTSSQIIASYYIQKFICNYDLDYLLPLYKPVTIPSKYL